MVDTSIFFDVLNEAQHTFESLILITFWVRFSCKKCLYLNRIIVFLLAL